MTKKYNNTVAEAYMHINNGGVTIAVVDTDSGPRLDINAKHFGNKTNGMELFVTSETLHELAFLLDQASKFKFTAKPYCVALEAPMVTLDANVPDCDDKDTEEGTAHDNVDC